MEKKQEIWLVRHGETAWSLSGQHTGWEDLPLLPEAEPKIKALQPHLDHPFALVLSSPLVRARRTAELAGFTSVKLDDNLKEWNYGDFGGKTKDDIQQLYPEWTIWSHGVKNGESLDHVAERTRRVIERATAVAGDVALVSHGHLLRILAACWLGLPPVAAKDFALSTASISILAYENNDPVIRQWNWRP